MKATENVSPLPANQTSPSSELRSDDVVRADSIAASPDNEMETLEKIRELLFGERSRATDRQLEELERRSVDEISRRYEEISERMGSLARDLGSRLDQLADQVARLETVVRENHEKAIAQAQLATTALDQAKVSREVLAGILAEMASRVGGK